MLKNPNKPQENIALLKIQAIIEGTLWEHLSAQNSHCKYTIKTNTLFHVFECLASGVRHCVSNLVKEYSSRFKFKRKSPRVRPAGLIIGKKSTGLTRGSCLQEANSGSPYMPPTNKPGGYPFNVNGYFVENQNVLVLAGVSIAPVHKFANDKISI